ncbi:MAG: TonB-dependent siderophore receptor [Gammaproteobacteria bacterium]|nr:TonB-dependent siderophore receptor [Gammaproteobacteria bacterium]MBU1488357.1 TonB-dependent siderophore receptor [Gammaproteobacteria bacterium]MBU2065319.1 TonB-dependent siderophore receptor [Gammaproteobacteria bacterium]MBU2140474.1 TonB-dependent siderophore receptor [Gammaproteobacteria bacterium]MBU2215732.1 TonB-dependent siderophore receptor [Gammaproteobacteria bacterium]
MQPCFKLSALTLAMLMASAPSAFAAEDAEDGRVQLQDAVVLGTAADELKQAPGVSIITAEDIKKRPPVNDLSEIIRKMPGVNLTGNSATGQYGNNRQIDLRGMGPENTLILIDGKPVSSRNSVRMGRSGERNTRGDTNWVPVEAVERVEVLRGPAAARYGSGAAGGVVNIITKAPTTKHSGSVTAYTNVPEDSAEGDTRRLGFNAAGPLTEALSYRVYGNLNRTDADDLSLNEDFASAPGATPPAGREGVRNKDMNGLLRWDLDPQQTLEFEGGFSRQGNIYAGDRAVSAAGTPLLSGLAEDGEETNIMYRQSASVTHRGDWDFGTSQVVASYENTRNRRLNEGLAGGPEGSINTTSEMATSELKSYRLAGEVNLPLQLGFAQVLTIGSEVTRDELDDPYSMSQSTDFGGAVPGADTGTRSSESEADNYALFIEDNIEIDSRWIVTPGLRLDHHSQFGSNWSPSLNSSYKLTDHLTLKGGVARAFKAPNLYQSNPNYLYFTMGNGCPVDLPSLGNGCYVQGNDSLEAETSLNKELGLAFDKAGWGAGLTYFHNDYKNKITAGMDQVGLTGVNGRIFQWENAPKAVVAGWEGFFNVPLLGTEGEILSWNNNFTYMIENHNKETREPLSVIPEYTLNSMLDWSVNQSLDLSLSMTHYGEQEPRKLTTQGGQAEGDALRTRGGYTVFGVTANYQLNDTWSFSTGVSNLFDKQLYREANSGGEGANTYNEPGRAYFASVTAGF